MKDVKTLVMILGIVVSLGVGFGGGYLFKAQQVSRMRQNLVGQFQGRVGMERNGNGMGIQNKGGGGIRGTMGEIISQDEKSITVKTVDGSSRIVILSDSTTYSEEKTTKKNNLTVGTKVGVFGSVNSDGSITAENIQINPMMRGQINQPSN
ncbi:hypothetical protein A2382_01470 [Candidatus Woesebacteria bacterium RIFOXYB1_FULL_38_16]|uniref:DUF5666 domain-containing protein n=1 Tax=Candidatus Woesebacteria bacterium RIFOXYB1_FULL_38_16 TaxID=1802538 RepID=A0A1F8CRW0_9BACT|nr:MAG: hypothetical protein A2191_01765 [Candidatus Woesebacteria bacterium RIFOXYA1_FULL_38_9]OGM79067.1 MAG: hypothetical protein A2382_01470 [Candidatus Woesebacteria bacterium RIFOXYB1_FULL_38_16]